MVRQKAGITPTRINQLKYLMIIGYAVIVFGAILIVSVLAIRKTDSVLKTKVSSLASSLNSQVKLNMESYLSRMETIGTLAFAADETYTYDATDPGNDEYDAINTEKAISDNLYSLCIMENFVDYGIVYSNNHTVGKISNGTMTLYGDRMYEEFSKLVTRERTHDGWSGGYEDNFKRLYYVKRIHENALLVISFYTTELANVFENPDEFEDMTVRLTNQDYHMLYSSGFDELGDPLPQELSSRIAGNTAATVLDDEYLLTVSTISNVGWYVVCSIPTEVILRDTKEMQLYIILTAIAAALLAAMIGALLSILLTRPVEGMVSKLDTEAHTDRLTGVLNKRSFEEYAEHTLNTALSIEKHALILLDVDDFKSVNDTLGHAYGDKVLAGIGEILRNTFSGNDYLGRIGGDEFCVLLNTNPDDENFEDYIRSRCEALCKAFAENYTGDDNSYKVSASIGAAVFHKSGEDFSALYRAADEALYASKKRGKDTYTIADSSA